MSESLSTYTFVPEAVEWRSLTIRDLLAKIEELYPSETVDLRADFAIATNAVMDQGMDCTLGDVITYVCYGADCGFVEGVRDEEGDRDWFLDLLNTCSEFFRNYTNFRFMSLYSPVETARLCMLADVWQKVEEIIDDEYLEKYPGDFWALNIRASVALRAKEKQKAADFYHAIIERDNARFQQDAAFSVLTEVYLPEFLEKERKCFLKNTRFPIEEVPYDLDKVYRCVRILKFIWEYFVADDTFVDIPLSDESASQANDMGFDYDDLERWERMFGPADNVVQFTQPLENELT